MWTGVILACTMTACQVFSGPIVASEQECFESVNAGAIYIQIEHPDLRIVDFRCIQWTEAA